MGIKLFHIDSLLNTTYTGFASFWRNIKFDLSFQEKHFKLLLKKQRTIGATKSMLLYKLQLFQKKHFSYADSLVNQEFQQDFAAIFKINQMSVTNAVGLVDNSKTPKKLKFDTAYMKNVIVSHEYEKEERRTMYKHYRGFKVVKKDSKVGKR